MRSKTKQLARVEMSPTNHLELKVTGSKTSIAILSRIDAVLCLSISAKYEQKALR